jgi:hypothetical protein
MGLYPQTVVSDTFLVKIVLEVFETGVPSTLNPR